MHKLLISIIVPCYNVQDYIEDCVNSVIHQTISDWELILVDDGSKDNTPQMCDEYARQDARVKVIHKENGGLVSARNAGYEAVKGEWMMYLDGDDWIDTDTCEKLQGYISKHEGIDVVFWNCVQELGDVSIKGKWEWKCTDQEHVYEGDECMDLAYNTLIYKSGIATAYSKLIRTDFARKKDVRHNPVLRQGAEGLDFSLRLFAASEKTLFVKEYFNHYRFNPNSISKKADERNTKYLIDCFREINAFICTLPQKERFRQAMYQRIVYVLIAIALSTYFHKDNKDSLITKCKKYSKVISQNSFFKDAVEKADVSCLDKQRKITFMLIKMKCYFMLPAISYLKQYFLAKGKYNY